MKLKFEANQDYQPQAIEPLRRLSPFSATVPTHL